MAMAMAMAKKQKKLILAQTKAQERLLLFWVGCVCPMGVLYEPTGAIQPKITKMRAYLPG